MLDNLILDIVVIFNILVLFLLFFCLPLRLKAGSGEITHPDLGEIRPFYAESQVDIGVNCIINQFFKYVVKYCQFLTATDFYDLVVVFWVVAAHHQIGQDLVFSQEVVYFGQAQVGVVEHAQQSIIPHIQFKLVLPGEDSFGCLVDFEILVQTNIFLKVF